MKKIILLALMMLPVAVFGQIKWAGEPGEKVSGSFKVFQVLSDTKALTHKKEDGRYYGPIFMIYHEPELYYEEAIIKAPKGMEFRLVGTYTYETIQGRERTVPVIQLMEKKKKQKKLDESND